MTDLSILIPARNEMFLARTIQDILEHAESDFEVIAVLDGPRDDARDYGWAEPPIPVHERVTVVHFPESIGQRAATNVAARLARGKYVMKVDAHCAFDQGFDRKMLEDMQPDWTMLPVMRNLHAFDWVCEKGHRRYQGPSGPCLECGGPTVRDVVWIAKTSPQSTAFRFDNTLHFQYWNEYKEKQIGDLVETMSIQGSCFMASREKYFELDLCDEKHGSWGQQGVEVACKTWLSGGRVVVTRKTWYAHMFRTQGGDFSFPYSNPGKAVKQAREYSRDLWTNNKWPKAIHPLSWLIDKFAPVPDWGNSWGVVYYTDNRLDPAILDACQRQLKKSVQSHRIVSVSLEKMDFGDNITLHLERGALALFRQILAGLEELDTDVVFFAEHDVLYHPSHFLFTPPDDKHYFYNTNVWKVRMSDGHGVYVDDCKQTSGLCANRLLLLEHYRKRVKMVEENGYSSGMGFEPGTHGRADRVDDVKAEAWKSEWPNLDLRHEGNLTRSRWTKEEFRNARYTAGWTEGRNFPGWGSLHHLWRKI